MSKSDKTFWNKTKSYFIGQKNKFNKIPIEQWRAKSESGLQNLFSPQSRPFVHKIFSYSTILILILFLIPIISHFLESAPSSPRGMAPVAGVLDFPIDNSYKLGEFMQQLQQLKQNDPFKTDHQNSSSNTDMMKICEDANMKSSLPFTLDSTIVMQDMNKSLAAVQLRSKSKIQAFRIAEKIESQARLDRIERLRIIFRNLKNGQCEYIANNAFDPKKMAVKLMDPTSAQNFINNKDKNDSIKNDGNSFEINKSFMKSKLTDLNSILTQARAIPLNNPDGTLSFRIEEVEPGGIFSTLGINNGDVITRINGQPITSYNEVMGMMNQLSNLNAVNITVLRNGTETPMQYNFVDQ
jgi:type II secretion system protein C